MRSKIGGLEGLIRKKIKVSKLKIKIALLTLNWFLEGTEVGVDCWKTNVWNNKILSYVKVTILNCADLKDCFFVFFCGEFGILKTLIS